MIIELISLLGIMVAQVIIPPIPAELIVVGAATQYGVLLTTFFAGSGLWLGSYLVYRFGSFLNTTFPSLFEKKKVKDISEKIRTQQSLILWIRILPYNPSDIISYAAGLLKFDHKRFVLITFVTSYVRCFLLAWLGSVITSLETALGVGAVLLFSALLAYVLVKPKTK